MAIPPFVAGMPGVRQAVSAVHRTVFRQGGPMFLAQGRVVDGNKSRDVWHSPDFGVLRAGLLLGRVTATGKYANVVIGTFLNAKAANATQFELTSAAATELVRRIGSSGTVRLIGPPTSGGTVAEHNVNYSAVNIATGVVTCSALPAAFIAGAFVCDTDGSAFPRTFVPDGYGINVLNPDGVGIDVPDAEVAVGGLVESAKLIPWPTDTSLQTWIVTRLNDSAGGQFVFDHIY